MFSLHVDTGRAWRGGQSHVRYLVLGLREIGQRAALVAHPEGELLRRMSEGLDLVPLAPRNEVDLAASWRLSRVLKQLRPDIIHAHDPHAVAMASTALSIASPTPKPSLVASQRIEAPLAHNSFSRWKYSQVDRFIANSEAIRNRLVNDKVRHDAITVIFEGVDVDRIAQLPSVNVHAEFFLPIHAPIVGNVGALVSQKGQHVLIDAAALVVREVPDARFVIVGDGELRSSLEHQIRKKHLERHILLAGFRTDALELTKGFDLFVLSSISEGTSIALVDAMAASKPAVCTAVGSVPEAMSDGETGFLVPPHDPNALATRIVQLLKDEALRKRMGDAALRRARERFTVERMVQETAGVYERLAGRSRAAGTANRAAPG